jgi:UTP--glucose-1-phosphate uridylyltransferase
MCQAYAWQLDNIFGKHYAQVSTNSEEKPSRPKSNLAVVAVYRFRPSIFKALYDIKDNKKELQLTDGIQRLIELGGKIHAVIVKKNTNVIDIGTPESYLENLSKSY